MYVLLFFEIPNLLIFNIISLYSCKKLLLLAFTDCIKHYIFNNFITNIFKNVHCYLYIQYFVIFAAIGAIPTKLQNQINK